MFPRESHMIYMVKLDSKNSKKLHLGRGVTLGHKCGFLCRNFILVVLRFTVSDEVKSASTVRELEI